MRLNSKHFLQLLIVLTYIVFLNCQPWTVAYASNINGMELSVDDNTGRLTIKTNPDEVATEDVAINAGLEKMRLIVVTLLAFAILTLIGILIKNFTSLGVAGANPQARGNAIAGLIVTGAAISGLGGVMIFFAFFYTLFQ